MQYKLLSSFDRDVKSLRQADILLSLEEILQKLTDVHALFEMQHCKKLIGYKDYYRIRIGDYRLGIKYNSSGCECVRFLPRKDFYRYFP